MTATVTAETRIGELLAAHPELEGVLVELAPAFRALRNPLLRRTVARVATVAQAAGVAGLPVPELVTALRRAVGQAVACDACPGEEDAPSTAPEPAWLTAAEPVGTLDAGALLDAGRTPVGEAAALLAAMEPGQVLLLTAPFRPAPLLDALAERGHEVWAQPTPGGTWKVFVRRGFRDAARSPVTG